MIENGRLVTMLPSANPDTARAFFRDVLGFSLIAEDQFALTFDAGGGARLRVQKVERFTPQPFSVVGWNVPDVRAAALALSAKGVQFERFEGMEQDEVGVWTPPSAPAGGGVCWFKDPDGNLLSLSRG